MLGNAPSELACKASVQTSAHPRVAPSQRIERCSPDLETGCPPWAARHVAPRTRIELVSLDRQSSCDASRITWLGVTYGLRSRQETRSQRAGFTSSLTSQSGKQESNLPDVSVPSGAAHLAPIPGCTPAELNCALHVFSAAISPVHLGVLRDPFRNRTGLARLKRRASSPEDERALDGRQLLSRRLPGLEPIRGIEPRASRYEGEAFPERPAWIGAPRSRAPFPPARARDLGSEGTSRTCNEQRVTTVPACHMPTSEKGDGLVMPPPPTRRRPVAFAARTPSRCVSIVKERETHVSRRTHVSRLGFGTRIRTWIARFRVSSPTS